MCVEKLKPFYIADGLIKLVQSLFTVSQKVKHRILIWPSNPNPRYIPKRNENICIHKNLYTNVHSDIIHNSSNKETQISINWWINNMWYIHIIKYYLIVKRNKALIYSTKWVNLKNVMLSERRQIQKTIQNNSIIWNV